MAQVKISQLYELSVSDGTEVLPIVSSGITKKIQIKNLAVDAAKLTYDNVDSGLSSVNVKSAIDELESKKIDNTEKGSLNGVASLGADSKIISSQIPAIAIVDTFVVANQTEQLALSAQQGDIAIRADETKSYVHNGGTAGDMTDWTWLQTPASDVLSVNGDTGVVTGLEEVVNRQNTLTDDDTKYPSSGAVVDYLNTHIAVASAHHNSLSNSLDITPDSVAIVGTAESYSHAVTTKTVMFGPADAEVYDDYIGIAGESGFQAFISPRYIRTTVDNLQEYYCKIPLGGHVPVGATITRIDMWGLTTSSSSDQLSIILYRADSNSEAYSNLGFIIMKSSQTTGFTTLSSVVLEGYKYVFRIAVRSLGSGNVNNVKFRGVLVTYTTTNSKQTI